MPACARPRISCVLESPWTSRHTLVRTVSVRADRALRRHRSSAAGAMAGERSDGAADALARIHRAMASRASHTRQSRLPARLRSQARIPRSTTTLILHHFSPSKSTRHHPSSSAPLGRPARHHPRAAASHHHFTACTRRASPRAPSAHRFAGPPTPFAATTPQNDDLTHAPPPMAAPPTRRPRADLPNQGAETRLMGPAEIRAPYYVRCGLASARPARKPLCPPSWRPATPPNGYFRPQLPNFSIDPPFFWS